MKTKMKRKITIILTALTLATTLTACSENTTTNTGNGEYVMIKIGSGLYFIRR